MGDKDACILELQLEIADITDEYNALYDDFEIKDSQLQKMASELSRLCDLLERHQQHMSLLTSDNTKLAAYCTQLEHDIKFLQENVDEQLKLRDQEVDHVLADVEGLVAKLNELGWKVNFTDGGMVFSQGEQEGERMQVNMEVGMGMGIVMETVMEMEGEGSLQIGQGKDEQGDGEQGEGEGSREGVGSGEVDGEQEYFE